MTPELADAELLGECRSPIARPDGADGSPYDLVLLDRDGVLNVQRDGYVTEPAQLELLPGAAEAVRSVNHAGCGVVLVTNQRGMATGRLTRRQLRDVHRTLVSQLAAAGAHLDAIQVCPHAENACGCRKPRPGLVREALRRAPWARAERCIMLGDRSVDTAAAQGAGVPAALVGGPNPTLAEALRQLISDSASRV